MNTEPETDDDAILEIYPDSESLMLGNAIGETWLKTRHSSFAELVHEFKAVEAELVMRAGDNEFYVLETKRRVVEAILKEAPGRCESFDMCRDLWNDLLRLGFTNMERKCMMTWFYAQGSLLYGEPEAGLAVLEPLIAELERLLAEPTATKQAARYYRHELDNLGKLLAKLKAQRNAAAAGP